MARREAETTERPGLVSQELPRIPFSEEVDDRNLEAGLRDMGICDAINGLSDSDFGRDGPSFQPPSEPVETRSRAVIRDRVAVTPRSVVLLCYWVVL
jgi:hypothetical protein